MSVMACHRHDCESVMCRRYSSRYGYICGGCFTELVHLGASANIREFMESERNQGAEEADFAYFNTIFPLEDD
jgi:hypothetical protein